MQFLVFERFTEKLPSHSSSWTRPVSHKLHGNFLTLWFFNQFLAPLPGRERCLCFLTSLVSCLGTSRFRFSTQVLQEKTCYFVPLLPKVGNRISRNCVAKIKKFHWTTKTLFCRTYCSQKKLSFCMLYSCYICYPPSLF